MKPGAFVASGFVFLLSLVMAPCAFAWQATATQIPPSAEAARIDQLIKDNRALLAQGKFDEVFSKAEEARVLSQQIGDKARQSRSIMQSALAAFHSGRIEEAIEPFKQAAVLAGAAGEQQLQALSLNSAAVLLTTIRRDAEALDFFNEVLASYRVQNDRAMEALVLRNISEIYIRMANYTKADDCLQNALRLARAVNHQGIEYATLFKLAALEDRREDFTLALKYAEQALALESPLTTAQNKYGLRNEFVSIHYRMGNLEKAVEFSEQALAIARTMKNALAEGVVLGNLACAQLAMGKTEQALATSTQALALLRQGDRGFVSEAKFLYPYAQAQRALGKPQEALESLRHALALLEKARLFSVPTEISRAELFSDSAHIFFATIDLLLELGKTEEAFAVAEAYHARAFLDLLSESRIDLRKDLTAAQSHREEALLNRISTVQKELWKPNLPAAQESLLKKELQTAEQELEAFQLELRRTNPRYADVKYPQPIKPERIAQELLDTDTALIEFVLSEKKYFAWVIHRGKLSSVVLPSQKEIGDLINNYRAALSEKASAPSANRTIASINAKSQQLYQKLFAPLEPHLTAARKLIIVPDGALLYLPFETLVRAPQAAKQQSQYLIERFALSYAPSASALAALKTATTDSAVSAKSVIAFGDPVYTDESAQPAQPSLALTATRAFDFRQLPYTRREVNEIAALFPSTERQTYLGAEAREQNVKTASLAQYRYVHFAAHGVIDEHYPARSGIVLSSEAGSKEDGVLQMSEVLRLKLNAELVTLSACRTGLGKLLNGEGMIGLTRAFLYAGADSVVVSLWNVNDIATAALMKAFYKHLKQGIAKDEALRQAKLSLLKGPQRAWQHPYYWAAFVLVGDQQ